MEISSRMADAPQGELIGVVPVDAVDGVLERLYRSLAEEDIDFDPDENPLAIGLEMLKHVGQIVAALVGLNPHEVETSIGSITGAGESVDPYLLCVSLIDADERRWLALELDTILQTPAYILALALRDGWQGITQVGAVCARLTLSPDEGGDNDLPRR
jgi:hypothetical protein